VRIEVREQFGGRPPRPVAAASLLPDGSVEVEGDVEAAEFLAQFRVHDREHDRWVSKDDDPELWFALLPDHVNSPYRSVVRVPAG
jgi:hypothetical protein